MSQIVLKLQSHGHHIEIPLTKQKKEITTILPSNYVFEDHVYEMEIAGEEGPFQVLNLCVNGNEESFIYRNGSIAFPGKDGDDRAVFSGYFGFASISISLRNGRGEILSLFSEYMSIKVREGADNRKVEDMLEFVLQHQAVLLFEKIDVSTKASNNQYKQNDNIEAKLSLAEEIARQYENSIGFFSANSQYRIREKNVVDHIEKLQYFSPQTLQYISTHPEHLKETTMKGGFRVAGKSVYPEKTLMKINVHSYDTYENRAILEFLGKVKNDLLIMQESIEELLQIMPLYDGVADGYIHSSWVLLGKTSQTLKAQQKRIQQIVEKYSALETIFARVFRITNYERMSRPPKKTDVFFSIPQYNILFYAIYRWFDYSEYHFEMERFLLDYVKISSLYELYVLCKVIEKILSNRARLVHSYEKRYILHNGALYQNTNSVNTFEFEDGRKRYTLFYQPVIYNRDTRAQTGIGLYRNNSYSYESKERGTYYAPDFVLKIESDGGSSYYIGDAKYKRLETVEDYDVAPTCYKYLTSVSPITEHDHVEGLFIVYGKCGKNERIDTIYDYQQHATNIEVRPKAFLVPLSE